VARRSLAARLLSDLVIDSLAVLVDVPDETVAIGLPGLAFFAVCRQAGQGEVQFVYRQACFAASLNQERIGTAV
jgi:hypothetical protein